jgi:2-dehydro-3-deoxyphosphogluconate aldolase/(4S)-4-hydroxy-2-oxoglutarate aldolase
MFEKRLLPVVVLDEVEHAEPLAEALLAGGLDVIELTLRTEAALEGIRRIRSKFPEMHVGAGTVLDAEVVPQLVDMGVEFAVAPGISAPVVEACQRAGLEIFPGITSPTEIELARSLGVGTLKFFPAEPLGGVSMLKALIGPYGHTGIRFVPTGGIDAEKAVDYAKLDAVAAIGGSWFVKGGLMKEGRFEVITQMTREAIERIAQV